MTGRAGTPTLTHRRKLVDVDVAAFVLACLALGWQAWTWLSERRFEVQVRIEPELVEVGSGRYEITVVVEKQGCDG